MIGRARTFLFWVVLAHVSLQLCACDEASPPPATTRPAAVKFQLDLKPLTPLLPNTPTHVAVDPLGNIYWAQETDRGDDTVFVIGQGDIPRATQLSVANIAAALNAPGARGNIHGLCSGPREEIYFYFSGALGRRSLACLGEFVPKTSSIRILADGKEIADFSGLGRSLPLARGTLISQGPFVWLWVRHTDAWAIFKFEPRNIAPSGSINLVKAFAAASFNGKPLELTREDYELAAAADDVLYLLDPAGGQLLSIDPAGKATILRSLAGLPRALSTPTVDRSGKLTLFAADGDLIPPHSADEAGQKALELNWPALLMFDGVKVTSIERNDMAAYPGFQVSKTRLLQLVPHAAEEGWISYDAGSGELLRLKILEKRW